MSDNELREQIAIKFLRFLEDENSAIESADEILSLVHQKVVEAIEKSKLIKREIETPDDAKYNLHVIQNNMGSDEAIKAVDEVFE